MEYIFMMHMQSRVLSMEKEKNKEVLNNYFLRTRYPWSVDNVQFYTWYIFVFGSNHMSLVTIASWQDTVTDAGRD